MLCVDVPARSKSDTVQAAVYANTQPLTASPSSRRRHGRLRSTGSRQTPNAVDSSGTAATTVAPTAASNSPSTAADGAKSAVDRVRHLVPAASRNECRAALAACHGDIESAARNLKVDQLTRLGIAPRERCQCLLEGCSWNLESAGSILLHQLSTGSSV